jgi:hypothetical protein
VRILWANSGHRNFYSKSSLEVTSDLYVAGCIAALDVEHYQEFCAKEGTSETLNKQAELVCPPQDFVCQTLFTGSCQFRYCA